MHISWNFFLLEEVVLDLELDGDDVCGGHGFLSFAVNVLFDGHKGHGFHDLLHFSLLSFVSIKEIKLCALF